MRVLPLVACALALPFFLWGFRTYQLAFAASHAIAILGLNLIAGQAGVISLGHGAFYGLGAYTMAVLMRQAGASAYAGIFAAPLVCLAAGYALGRIVAPFARFYLALATFALALAVPQTLKSSHLTPWTGGVLMILGYAIIAVPTGIVSAELALTHRPVSRQACPGCGAEGHEVDAVHCKYCGASL